MSAPTSSSPRLHRSRRPAPPGRPAVSDSAQRVLDAALELFGEHGYDGTSLQMIADRLQVTKAAVYYHYRTKNELLEALVGPTFDDLERVLEHAASRPRADDRRESGLTGYVDYLLRHRKVAGFLSRDIAAVSQPEVWQRVQSLSGRVEGLLTEGSAATDALSRLWGTAALAGMNGALVNLGDADEPWLREQLTELGRHMAAGYRRARRRDDGSAADAPA